MKKYMSKLFNIFMIISLVISFMPPAANAAEAEDREAALNQQDTPYAEYEMAANTPYSSTGEGEQISDATGTLRRIETDFTLSGRNGLNVVLSRLYQGSTAYVYEPKAEADKTALGDPIIKNETEYYTYNEQTSNLGVGWTWAFPSV
ncbi:hypothetical protein Q5741_16100, partial [Paenibacillus sp. JX-17]